MIVEGSVESKSIVVVKEDVSGEQQSDWGAEFARIPSVDSHSGDGRVVE